jgi:hypothetical protein
VPNRRSTIVVIWCLMLGLLAASVEAATDRVHGHAGSSQSEDSAVPAGDHDHSGFVGCEHCAHAQSPFLPLGAGVPHDARPIANLPGAETRLDISASRRPPLPPPIA